MTKYVCQTCIEDIGLQVTVKENEENEQCSYCDCSKAALLEYVTDHMKGAIGTRYGDLQDNLDLDGQLPEHFDIDGVFSDIGFHLQDEDLMDDIRKSFGARFYTVDKEAGFLSRVRFDAWKEFQVLVKHQRRYTFSTYGYEQAPDLDALLWTPRNLLTNISNAIHELPLIEKLPAGTSFWRVRLHDSAQRPNCPAEYTSPPRQYALYPNRMSPAGIPMFYGAEDFETAVFEVTSPNDPCTGKSVSGVKFATESDLLMLDLTDIPSTESFFVDWEQSKRMAVSFLDSFANDLSRPIKKDGREHIDYVPSQVFTEYIRHELQPLGGGNVMGIKYRSSKNGKVCCVIFVEQDQCLPATATSEATQVLNADLTSFREELLHGEKG
jgi:hypothetical protein